MRRRLRRRKKTEEGEISGASGPAETIYQKCCNSKVELV